MAPGIQYFNTSYIVKIEYSFICVAFETLSVLALVKVASLAKWALSTTGSAHSIR